MFPPISRPEQEQNVTVVFPSKSLFCKEKRSMLRLLCGTESTWSLRAWICAHLAEVQFEEQVISLGAPGYKAELRNSSDSGLVPVLEAGDARIHDSLAICEYFNELSGGALLPENREERALSRSMCAELHSGFVEIRTECPFSSTGKGFVHAQAGIAQELKRVEAVFASARLPFMFDKPGMVDAFFAILAYRLASYDILLAGKAGEYQQSLLDWDMLKAAVARAIGWRGVG